MKCGKVLLAQRTGWGGVGTCPGTSFVNERAECSVKFCVKRGQRGTKAFHKTKDVGRCSHDLVPTRVRCTCFTCVIDKLCVCCFATTPSSHVCEMSAGLGTWCRRSVTIAREMEVRVHSWLTGKLTRLQPQTYHTECVSKTAKDKVNVKSE